MKRIKDYEKGILSDIAESFTSGGQTVHTVLLNSTSSSNSSRIQEATTCPPPPKKSQTDFVRMRSKIDNGYVLRGTDFCSTYMDTYLVYGIKFDKS